MSTFKAIKQGNTEAQVAQWSATLFPTTGVVSGLGVTATSPASASVTVAAGWANSVGTALQGATQLRSDTAITLNVLGANPNPGGNPRNDLIVLDPVAVSVSLIVGVASAIPDDPAVPAGSVKLARLRHAAGATTVPSTAITDLRSWTSAVAGPLVVGSLAERNALTPYDGLRVWRTDTHEFNTYVNGAWTDGSWTAFTPVWTQTGGTVLQIGNGSLSGWYKANGKSYTVRILLVRGSTTNLGTAGADYFFGLPFTLADFNHAGPAFVRRSNAPTFMCCLAVAVNSDSIVVYRNSTESRIGPTSPGSWAAGDAISLTMDLMVA